jgi:hypothetical protein
MDQRAPYLCSRHKKLNHDYPECLAEARATAIPEPVKATAIPAGRAGALTVLDPSRAPE